MTRRGLKGRVGIANRVDMVAWCDVVFYASCFHVQACNGLLVSTTVLVHAGFALVVEELSTMLLFALHALASLLLRHPSLLLLNTY